MSHDLSARAFFLDFTNKLALRVSNDLKMSGRFNLSTNLQNLDYSLTINMSIFSNEKRLAKFNCNIAI